MLVAMSLHLERELQDLVACVVLCLHVVEGLCSSHWPCELALVALFSCKAPCHTESNGDDGDDYYC